MKLVSTEHDTEDADRAYSVACAVDRATRYDALQALYRKLWRRVKVIPPYQWAIDPNAVHWPHLFSPIEEALWGEIRYEGAVLYPQHPVGNYFVDFGHPLARVAIECDGKRWHTDKTRDAARQREIEAYGWTVYRLTGRECFALAREEFDTDGCEATVEGAAVQLLREVCKRHLISPRYAKEATA